MRLLGSHGNARLGRVLRGHGLVGPTFDLNFLTGVMPSGLTYTRASTATYIGSDGLLKTAAVDEPRFDYDPITLACKGLLIEGSRTNMLLQSGAFDNAAWVKSNATVTANTTTAPDGATSADKLIESASSSTHLVTQGSIAFAAGIYTLSVFCKAAERSHIRLVAFDGATGFAVYFNISAGTVGGAIGGAIGSIQNIGSGWFRCAITFTAAAGTGNIALRLANSTPDEVYLGDGTSGVIIWGAQLEAGAFASSYIPTTTAAVTRAADSCLMTGANFSRWFNPLEGTIVAEFTAANGAGSAAQGVFAIGDRSADFPGSSAIYVGRETSTVMSAISRSAGVTDVALGAANVANADTAKIALAYKANDFVASLNGGTVVTDTSAVVPVVTAMSIGDFKGGWQTAQNQLFGHIRRIPYWPRRLSNARLQELTA